MKDSDDSFDRLVQAVLDGPCLDEDVLSLQRILRNDRTRREEYIRQAQVHALLKWRSGTPIAIAISRKTAFVSRRNLRIGLALLACAAAVVVVLAVPGRRPFDSTTGCAEIVEADGVRWGSGSTIWQLGDRIPPGELHIEAGLLRVRFDSGTFVSLQGPSAVAVIGPTRIRMARGRLMTRMPEGASGFTVETSAATVIDQGTEVGLAVDPVAGTQVVVFEGAIDLHRTGRASATERLTGGEAVHLDRDGGPRRIVAVERPAGSDAWTVGPSLDPEALIRSVSDNITALGSSKFYRIVRGGLVEDARVYVDRTHEWNGLDHTGLPKPLIGADLVMTFNDDKRNNDLEITVDLARPANLYVLFDDRGPPPHWLAQNFTDTGWRIGMDEGPSRDETFTVGSGPGVSIDRIFQVWVQRVEQPRAVVLGPTERGGLSPTRAMYGIAATPLVGD